MKYKSESEETGNTSYEFVFLIIVDTTRHWHLLYFEIVDVFNLDCLKTFIFYLSSTQGEVGLRWPVN